MSKKAFLRTIKLVTIVKLPGITIERVPAYTNIEYWIKTTSDGWIDFHSIKHLIEFLTKNGYISE